VTPWPSVEGGRKGPQSRAIMQLSHVDSRWGATSVSMQCTSGYSARLFSLPLQPVLSPQRRRAWPSATFSPTVLQWHHFEVRVRAFFSVFIKQSVVYLNSRQTKHWFHYKTSVLFCSFQVDADVASVINNVNAHNWLIWVLATLFLPGWGQARPWLLKITIYRSCMVIIILEFVPTYHHLNILAICLAVSLDTSMHI
jgi:hypothetical protein